MNETMVTVVGNVATAPVFRELPSGSATRFRLAATARYVNRETGQWSDGHTNFFTVWAWRSLGANAAASLAIGEPVIVQGKLRVRNEDRGGGQQWMSADIDAVTIGHDLSRGTAAFRRILRRDGTQADAQPAPFGGPGPQPAADDRPPVQWERPAPPERATGAEVGGPPAGKEGALDEAEHRSVREEDRRAPGEDPAAGEGEAPAQKRSGKRGAGGTKSRQPTPEPVAVP